MKKIKVVCGVVRNEGKYLITQRGDAKNYKKWEFPGGKVESNEDDFSSIKRELLEELNLSITPIKEVVSYGFKSFQLVFIECICLNSESIELMEHLNYAWVHVNELAKFDFLEGDKKFIAHLIPGK